MKNKFFKWIFSYFRRKKQSKQLAHANIKLDAAMNLRNSKKRETNKKIITYARSRIRSNQSRFIPQKKVSRTHLLAECRSGFKSDLENCGSVLASDFKVKTKTIR